MDSVPLKQTQVQTRVNEFIRSVYNWMAIGLGLTGFVAYYVANTPALVQAIFGNRILFFGLIIGELALVFIISARIQKMQASTATALFVVYSILNGATLSFIFLVYTASSITSTFFICAATFVCLQRIRMDHQTGSNLHGRLYDHGTDRHHYCLCGEHVFPQFGDEHDYQLHRRHCFCGAWRPMIPSTLKPWPSISPTTLKPGWSERVLFWVP